MYTHTITGRETVSTMPARRIQPAERAENTSINTMILMLNSRRSIPHTKKAIVTGMSLKRTVSNVGLFGDVGCCVSVSDTRNTKSPNTNRKPMVM